MAKSLDDWQRRVEQHFQNLSRKRAGTGLDVFAIEHGLANDEIEQISDALRLHLRRGHRLSKHWLLWVIYSTEQGYEYKGDEYWPSFESQTPCWDERHRSKLSLWFNTFLNTYSGVVPSGRWADHFSIISRPITHAILPKYLQHQFAKELYHQRYSLVDLTSLSASDVGRRFANNACHSSSRFHEFLQQEELAGRIVLGLLEYCADEVTEPIYPPTMDRIVRDLKETRNAGEWLGETRRFVRDRFIGIAGKLPDNRRSYLQSNDLGCDWPLPDVRPKVFLSHCGGGKWMVWAEAPSFKDVCASSANIRSFVKATRCRFNGADDYKPSGWLLSGNRKGILRRWPDPAEPMIQFERTESFLENLLQTSCRISSGPIWLFRIGEDGTAREIISGNLRPACKYIILSNEKRVDPKYDLQLLNIDCAGVWAFRLVTPSKTTADFDEWLSQFNLKLVHTTRVWPAGLPGRNWNGEGQSEWLTTETPVIGMAHDYEVDRYLLSLNEASEIAVETDRPDEPVFVRLPRLQVGQHVLKVRAKRRAELSSVPSTPEAEGHIELSVREPEPWISGDASLSGMIGNLEPHDADLETFWRNEVNLAVFGPEGRTVSARVRLRDRTGNEILSKNVSGQMELPLRPDKWKKCFAQFLNRCENSSVYHCAATGELDLSVEELGTLSFQFEHNFLPLRWVVKLERDDFVLRIVDDTGIDTASLIISYYNMKKPVFGLRLPQDQMLTGGPIQQPGGLLIARKGKFEDYVVISSKHTGEGFGGLKIDSDFSQLRTANILKNADLILYSKWHNARRYGPIVEMRWDRIRDQYLGVIYEKLCGQNWSKAENALNKTPTDQRCLDSLERAVVKRTTEFSSVLRREYDQPAEVSPRDLSWYANLTKQHHICSDARLTDFAFCLAREAHEVPQRFGNDVDKLLNAIRDNPSVLRGARFLQLADEHARRSLECNHGSAK